MSRSGYTDDCEDMWAHIRWRGAVNSAIKGKRGQKLLRELIAGLDAMPEKGLIAQELEADGEYCALGVVGCGRGIDLKSIDPEDYFAVAKAFDISEALAREIVFVNDEAGYYGTTAEQRWRIVRNWAEENLIKEELNDEQRE